MPESSFFGHLNALVSVGIEITQTVGRLSMLREANQLTRNPVLLCNQPSLAGLK